MNNLANPEEWNDVQFMFDASCEFLEANYEKAFSILRQGIEEKLLESDKPIESEKLLHTLRLLISSIEKGIFGLKFDAEKYTAFSENRCSFCGAEKSETTKLLTGTNGNICDSCIRNICSSQNLI